MVVAGLAGLAALAALVAAPRLRELGAAFGVERFLREIGIVARLAHPHVVPLIDSGDAGGGMLYYVSAYVPGGSLRDRLRREGRLAIDDALAVAHTSLGWCLFIYDWDWDGAAREFRRAIQLDPHYATAHQWYAFLLTSRGAFGEALVEGHTAVELDAGSVSARRSLGGSYMYARRWDQARYHLERSIAMNPNAEESYRSLGLVLALAGEHDEAERVLREAVTMDGAGSYTHATLGFALARAGRAAEARAILAELEARAAEGYVSPVAFATVLCGLGEVERALDWTERAYEDRRGWLAYLKVSPVMDPMRGHARFEALVERMRL